MPSYITRITNNNNEWINPSNAGIEQEENGFVGLNGFGFEEWWRNEQFQLIENGDLFQYGFLQSLNILNVHPRTIDEVYLYTRIEGENRIVAKLNNLIVLDQVGNIEDIENRFMDGIQNIRDLLLESVGDEAVERFNARPYAGNYLNPTIRCLFNFKVKVENIEYYGWENGNIVDVRCYYYRLIRFNL